jgi:hypothetical protein
MEVSPEADRDDQCVSSAVAIWYHGRGLAGRWPRRPATTATAAAECGTAELADATRPVSGNTK